MDSEKIVLIVDDAPENLSILGDYLVEYKVKVAINGKKALSIAGVEPRPDLILLDIIMPEMDGYEVCKKLKENPQTRNIPVIFISSMSDVTDKVKGFQIGAVDYITKPFQIEEVKSRINTHLTLSTLQKRLKNINHELETKVQERTIELLIAKDKAEESNRIKSYFLALMSHELRTPMNGILGFSCILMEKLSDESLCGYAAAINRSAYRLHNTLDSILSFANIESGKLKANYNDFEIISKTKNLLKIHEISAKLKNIQMVFNTTLPHFPVKIDEIMYEIIINNLLSNSIKYSDKGTVTTEIFEEMIDNHTFCCLRISDMGEGIPVEKQRVIFEEFRQADEGLTRQYEGVGLGLSLVKKYIDIMDGKIELFSQPDKGTTFTIKIPSVPKSNQKN